MRNISSMNAFRTFTLTLQIFVLAAGPEKTSVRRQIFARFHLKFCCELLHLLRFIYGKADDIAIFA